MTPQLHPPLVAGDAVPGGTASAAITAVGGLAGAPSVNELLAWLAAI
jgi:hypothetical protein